MDDQNIIELYNQRDQRAITETQLKYGAYCMEVAYRVLQNRQDAEECVNDAYLRTWNAIPPQKPYSLKSFLAKITRNLALNRYRDNHTQRKGYGEVAVALDELSECVSDGESITEDYLVQELSEYVDRFLKKLSRKERNIFLCRYYFLYTTQEIATKQGTTEAYVRTNLSRTRRKLKLYLEKEGLL